MSLFDKYLNKLKLSKLADKAIYIVTEDTVTIYGDTADKELSEIASHIKTYSLLFVRPAEPFMSALEAAAKGGEFAPNDSETRTFLHTVPVADSFSEVPDALKRRKAVFVRGQGIATAAPFGAEQAFIFASSVIFSGFVKFFADAGEAALLGKPYDKELTLELLNSYIKRFAVNDTPSLDKDIFQSEQSILSAMAQAGRTTVYLGLVDSFFGNISVFEGKNIYISRTGSSLDELENETDICPLDESTCTGLTASSELASHRRIYETTDKKVILHAHPRFAVIMSMMCAEKCENRGKCHYACTKERYIGKVPIVSGEVGNGPRAMVNTLPPAMKKSDSVTVYGHGVFTVSAGDFNEALRLLTETETAALKEYQKIIIQ
ncbi:class II aldolase/adducin family protein [Seleniivibrio sp.]|uniref:class II aldolase/adducin family protein n=1 Tax=Seleniivibrio sp. TaxID=2898801 RepID=UPI0025DA40EB|nr:class II aldolase/adducin family protein [Seleniivibrio sp.]MCD8553248.1 class II aldolase/adducin family protein [Seleniivibrio sp.]